MLKLRHTDALIELLSVIDESVLIALGMTEQEIDALDDVFDMACGHHENVVGLAHPLEEPIEELDGFAPAVVVVG
ncbi:MAG: hypothetical protein JWO24_2945 [Rhodospirillales bacterium]|nr:hypothetical protein [Rhodospirillales bacterium]